jgi:O-antigen/teichoic acid export membrane protein
MIRPRIVALLGLASGVDYAAQVLVPILLVRVLSAHDFGGYRLLWLAAQTCANFLSMSVAALLVKQVPQQPPRGRGALFGNAFAYLAVAALPTALLLSPLTPLVPRMYAGGAVAAWLPPLFSALWLVSLPFDYVALACQRPPDQALLSLGQAVLRVGPVVAAALLMRSLTGVGLALIVLAAARILAALIYASRRSQLDAGRGLSLDRDLARLQLRDGLGFGTGFMLGNLRGQTDGWVAALRFDPVAVAIQGVALAAAPLITVLRMAVTNAIAPAIAADVAAGRMDAAVAANRRGNLMVAALLFPLCGMLIALADPLLAFVFTPRFSAAVLPFRIYVSGLLVAALETTTLALALGASALVLRQGAILLPLAATACYVGASVTRDPTLGLCGIAIGATAVGWLSQIWMLVYVQRALGLAWAQFQAWGQMCALLLVNLGATLFTLAIMPALPTRWPMLLQLFAGGVIYLAAALAPSLAWARVGHVYRDLLGVARARRGPLQTPMSRPVP